MNLGIMTPNKKLNRLNLLWGFLLIFFTAGSVWGQRSENTSPKVLVDSLSFAEEDTLRQSLNLLAEDDETPGSAIEWRIDIPADSPLHFEIDPNRNLLLWADPDWNGTAGITVTATDAEGASTEKTLVVVVQPVHDIFMGRIVLFPEQELKINLRGHIAVPDTVSLNRFEWEAESISEEILKVEFSDTSLILTSGPEFPKASLFLLFSARDIETGRIDSDLAEIFVVRPSAAINPSDRQTLDLEDPDFRFLWTSTSSSDPDKSIDYILRVGSRSGASDIFEGTVTDTSLNRTDLEGLGISLEYRETYFWSITSRILPDLLRSMTEERSFRVEHRPEPFNILQPAPDVVWRGLRPTFRWEGTRTADSSTVSYVLEISVLPDLDSLRVGQNVGADTVFTLSERLSGEQVYYWRVRAQANNLDRLSSDFGGSRARRFRVNLFSLLAPPEGRPADTQSPIFRWNPYFFSFGVKAVAYLLFLEPAPEGSIQPIFVQAESLVVGGSQIPDPLPGEVFYSWRIATLSGPDTIWASPNPGRFFAGERRVREFYGYPNPFNPRAGERATFHAEFVVQAIRGWLKIRTAHPPHTPLIERELRLGPTGLGFDAAPTWDGRDVFGRQMADGVYIAEFIVEYRDGERESVYYPMAIGLRLK